MKKISVTMWLILGAIFLYTASLWQRPLFISEFAGSAGAVDALYNGVMPSGPDMPLYYFFSFFGTNPFTFRLFPALLALVSAGVVFIAGRKSALENVSKTGALIFLLTPALFLSGTTSLSFMYNGAPVILSFFLLFIMSESDSWKKTIAAGIGAALVLAAMPFFQNSATSFTVTAVSWLLYCVTSGIAANHENEKRKISALFLTLLPFLPGLALLFTAKTGFVFQLPRIQDVKNIAAFAVAGSFPWIVFLPLLLRNFSSRILFMLRDRFLLSASLLGLASFAVSFFTPLESGFLIPFLAGAALVLAAGLEIEWSENGFRSANIVTGVLAVLFFLAALVIGVWAALGLYTEYLKPAWKIFNARDSWILTAAVPAVTAIWYLTSLGEKLRKEQKFLAFCAGTAFLLLAFHGLTPLKVTEFNAPGSFLQKVVLPRTTSSTIYYGDGKMLTPLQCVFRDSPVKSFSLNSGIQEIKEGIKNGRKMCVVTHSRQVSEKLPFPKTTLRSGNFIAVFYNIDFPEMRVRKP